MSDKKDLLIHFDEDAHKFVFYSVDAKDTSTLRAGAFGGVCPEVSFFKEKAPDEAEQTMGGMVFSFLDHGSINRVNIRDYKAESEAAMQQWDEELEAAAKNNDSEAQYCLFMRYHSKSLKSRKLSDLERAEELLFASANAGYSSAQKALEDWPLMKAAAERSIQRGSSD